MRKLVLGGLRADQLERSAAFVFFFKGHECPPDFLFFFHRNCETLFFVCDGGRSVCVRVTNESDE